MSHRESDASLLTCFTADIFLISLSRLHHAPQQLLIRPRFHPPLGPLVLFRVPRPLMVHLLPARREQRVAKAALDRFCAIVVVEVLLEAEHPGEPLGAEVAAVGLVLVAGVDG